MTKNRKYLKLIVGLSIIAIAFLASAESIFYLIADKLSKSKPIDAEALLVEGWLPYYALDMAYKEFNANSYETLFISGTTSDYFILDQNGCFVFNTAELLSDTSKITPNILEINAFSELGAENSAHFNVYINDSLVKDFFSKKRNNKHELIWEGSLAEIDSVTIEFINDKHGPFGDRNLYLKNIVFNNEIFIPFHNNTKFVLTQKNGKRISHRSYLSNAELAKDYLISKGIDSSKIIAIPSGEVKINRTLNSALAVKNWILQSERKINDINVLSMGIHSHRTWTTYHKIFKEICDIGIISVPDYQFDRSRRI